MNTITKLKQQTKEFFNKKIKTVDANFEKRMIYVNHLDKKVNDLFNSVKIFLIQSNGKHINVFDMISEISQCTEQMGTTLKICYSGSAYESLIQRLEQNLRANKDF